jgi:hypothetical protein
MLVLLDVSDPQEISSKTETNVTKNYPNILNTLITEMKHNKKFLELVNKLN